MPESATRDPRPLLERAPIRVILILILILAAVWLMIAAGGAVVSHVMAERSAPYGFGWGLSRSSRSPSVRWFSGRS